MNLRALALTTGSRDARFWRFAWQRVSSILGEVGYKNGSKIEPRLSLQSPTSRKERKVGTRHPHDNVLDRFSPG